jgi:hypothetical protein
MNKLVHPLCTSLLFAFTLTLPAVAQTLDTKTDTPSPTGEAADLRIAPRFGLGYSTSGAGYDAFSRFESFVPLSQNPGISLTFLEGRLLLSNDWNLGGNVLLGHRFYDASRNRIRGGYIAYDIRDTGNSTFSQIAAGFESLGNVWDFRINGFQSNPSE